MNRRDLLAGLVSSGLVGAAGCSGSTPPGSTTDPETSTRTPEETTRSLPSMSVTAVDTRADGDVAVQLDVRWRARTQLVLDPPERDVRTLAEDGFKWLVVQLAVTNNGTSEWDARPVPFIVETNGDRFEITTSRVESYFGGEPLAPGESVSGWLSFHIPRDARTAELHCDPSLSAVDLSAAFDVDASLAFTVD